MACHYYHRTTFLVKVSELLSSVLGGVAQGGQPVKPRLGHGIGGGTHNVRSPVRPDSDAPKPVRLLSVSSLS